MLALEASASAPGAATHRVVTDRWFGVVTAQLAANVQPGRSAELQPVVRCSGAC
jgi:hypothetical protein